MHGGTNVLSTPSRILLARVIAAISEISGTLINGFPMDSIHTMRVSGRIASATRDASCAGTKVTEMLFRLQILWSNR